MWIIIQFPKGPGIRSIRYPCRNELTSTLYSRSRNDMWRRPAAAAALIDFCALARWLAAMGPIVCIALGDSIASSSRLPARPEWSYCYREYIPTLSGRRCDASGAHGLAGACQRSPLPVNALGR